MAIADMKNHPSHDTPWTSGRVRSAKEAAQLLEALRTAYQSLPAGQRHEVKHYMANLQESQRRFGSTCMALRASWYDRTLNG